MRRINRSKARKEELREAAKAAEEKWQALSPAEQLKQLDARLGEGKGATRQRARIAQKLAAAKAAKEADRKAAEAKKAAKAAKAKKAKKHGKNV